MVQGMQIGMFACLTLRKDPLLRAAFQQCTPVEVGCLCQRSGISTNKKGVQGQKIDIRSGKVQLKVCDVGEKSRDACAPRV